MGYQQLTEGNDTSYRCFAHRGCPSLPPHAPLAFIAPPSTGSCVVTPGRRATSQNNAHQHATHRRASAAKSRLSADVIQFVELTLAWWWSPEQISTVGKQIGLMVSHEWIYRHVAADKARVASCTAICARATSATARGEQPAFSHQEARSIDERPAIVDSREQLGDWEADTVLEQARHRCTGHPGGAQRAGSIWSKRVASKQAGVVRDAIIEMLTPYIEQVHTYHAADSGGRVCQNTRR